MAMKAIISAEAYNKLSDEFKAEYKKGSDGKYKLDVSEVDGFKLEDVTGLRSALETERENATQANKKLKAFGDLDPSEAREAVKKSKDFDKNITDSEKFKTALADREKQIVAKHQKEMDDVTKQRDGYHTQMSTLMIDNAATDAILEHKGNVKLLLPHVRQQVKLVTGDDGTLSTQVINVDSGTPRITLKSGKQDPMGIAELVGTMKDSEDFSRAFAGSGNRGTGSHTDHSNNDESGGGQDKIEISSKDQDAIDANIDGIAEGTHVVVDVEG